MLLNSLLFFLSIVICFGLVLVAKKFFGKSGLYAWIAIATIIANIEVTKLVPMLGFNNYVTLGNVSFASIFLATDILATCYGFKASKKGVYIGLFSSLVFLGLMQLDLLFIPSSADYVHGSLSTVFGLDGVFIWVTLSSVIMFFLSNLLNVYLFDKLKKKFGDKHLWVCNNVATILANCLENFLFVLFGYFILQFIFTGVTLYSITQCLAIAGTTCLFEIVIALLDTPVLYLARKMHLIEKEKQDELD